MSEYISAGLADDSPVFKKHSQVREVWRRLKKDRVAVFGLSVIVTLIVLAISADLIIPYQAAVKMDVRNRLSPPSAEHWFGCDAFGRDMFARCLHGSRVSLLIGFSTSFISLVLGGAIGSTVGYLGGKIDNAVMRILDLFSSIPTILFALTIVAALGSGILNICIAITVTRIPGFVRIVRSSVLGIADMEYIEAARAGGTSTPRIIFRHVLPNAVGPLIVQTTMNVATIIILAASLSFLGLGINPPQPEWGALISEAKEFLRTAPFLIAFPGIMICLASFSISVLGDGLRDALDPRLKS
ncbi:MAG: ABC transporter permease [Synergistaceae bacterium]|jgi:peptide/nickel transport system permease protein|nr:ABC transporter permease [Synergistaceae bacterium]